MSPAPTARARPSPSCARCWRRRASSVHVYTSPHLVRFNERFRLGAPGGGRLVDDEALADALDECERANGGEPITVFEIETAAAFLLFSRASGRRAAARSRPRRPARRHQRDRAAARQRRSRRSRWTMWNFSATRIEKIAAEKAGILKRGVPAVIAPQTDARARRYRARGRARARAARVAGEHWSAHERARPAGLSGRRRACSICRCRSSSAAISSTTPAPPSRRCAPPGSALPIAAFEAGIAKAEWPARHAAPDARARSRRSRRRSASSGSTAATTPTAAARSRRRSAISRSACRARWC